MTIKYKLLGIPGNIEEFLDKIGKNGDVELELGVASGPDEPRISDDYMNDRVDFPTQMRLYAVGKRDEKHYNELFQRLDKSMIELSTEDFVGAYKKIKEWETLAKKNGFDTNIVIHGDSYNPNLDGEILLKNLESSNYRRV